MIFIGGSLYAIGICIIGLSAHLRWWTGFGIWLTGLGLMVVIVHGVRNE